MTSATRGRRLHGYTGLWTARPLKELVPFTEVVLIERDVCGAGASGSNAGWKHGMEALWKRRTAASPSGRQHRPEAK